MDSTASERFILDLLGSELSETLFYHGLHHTLDVTRAALILAKEEGVEDDESLGLLKTAAFFHDCGFINTYKDHEEEGCRIVRQTLPLFEYTDEQIEIICGMIMATKIPQSPKTHLEKIICDADLDYLSRDDYEPIAATLFQELFIRNLLPNENVWNQLQVKFIGSHRYHTESGRNKKEVKKQKHLNRLQILIKI